MSIFGKYAEKTKDVELLWINLLSIDEHKIMSLVSKYYHYIIKIKLLEFYRFFKQLKNNEKIKETEVMESAVKYKNINIFIYCVNKYIDRPVNKYQYFNICSKNGELEMFKYIESYYVPDVLSAFENACIFGHLNMAKYIYEKYLPSYFSFYGNANTTFINIMRNGHYEMAKYFLSVYKIYFYNENVYEEALSYVSTYGNIDIVLYLLNKNPCIHYNEEEAFRNACDHGHLEIARILYSWSIDNETKINIHAVNEYAFRYASANGHRHILEFLINLSIKDHIPINISAVNHFAFKQAILNDHLEIAKIIYNISLDLNINIMDNRIINESILKHTYKFNKSIFEWLISFRNTNDKKKIMIFLRNKTILNKIKNRLNI